MKKDWHESTQCGDCGRVLLLLNEGADINSLDRYSQTALINKVTAFLTSPKANKHFELEHNDSHAAAMARVHYRRPPLDDLSLMAAYWKQYYNTPLGKGVAHEYVTLWNTYVGGKGRLTYLNQCS